MNRFLIFLDMWASTRCSLASATRNIVPGSTATIFPSVSIGRSISNSRCGERVDHSPGQVPLTILRTTNKNESAIDFVFIAQKASESLPNNDMSDRFSEPVWKGHILAASRLTINWDQREPRPFDVLLLRLVL